MTAEADLQTRLNTLLAAADQNVVAREAFKEAEEHADEAAKNLASVRAAFLALLGTGGIEQENVDGLMLVDRPDEN